MRRGFVCFRADQFAGWESEPDQNPSFWSGSFYFAADWASWVGKHKRTEPKHPGSTTFQTQNSNPFFLVVTSLLFLSGWVLVWTPLENFGKYYYYLQGAYPFIVWLTCASAAAVFLLWHFVMGSIFKNGWRASESTAVSIFSVGRHFSFFCIIGGGGFISCGGRPTRDNKKNKVIIII